MAHRLYIRRFLNKRGHHAGGYILASVEDTSKRKGDDDWVHTQFTIADCGRQINLDFDVDPRDLANSLYKVDNLLDALERFRAALVIEGETAAARAKSRKTTARQRTSRDSDVPIDGPEGKATPT